MGKINYDRKKDDDVRSIDGKKKKRNVRDTQNAASHPAAADRAADSSSSADRDLVDKSIYILILSYYYFNNLLIK